MSFGVKDINTYDNRKKRGKTMTRFPLDELDQQILSALQADGRAPFLAIAEQLGVSEGTVRKRVSRLLKEQYLQIRGLLDPFRLGLGTSAVVGVQVEGGKGPDVVEVLGDMPEVRSLAVCAGTYDLIIEVAVTSNEDLFRFLTGKLRTIPGVVSSDTSLILKKYKEGWDWKPTFQAEKEEEGK